MDCNFTVGRDKSFADDLEVVTGRVPSRVALSLRAGERQPGYPRFVGGLMEPTTLSRSPRFFKLIVGPMDGNCWILMFDVICGCIHPHLLARECGSLRGVVCCFFEGDSW
jgi:hypothetical protein